MKKALREEHAFDEAAWFYRSLGGKVPEGGDLLVRDAAAQIEAALRRLPSYHRGVFALRYLPREWPAVIAEEFHEMASLVVRLECTLRPAVGVPTAALEQASVERLQVAIAARVRTSVRLRPLERRRRLTPEEKLLFRLGARACAHLDSAISALAKVRGDGPCLVPGSTGS